MRILHVIPNLGSGGAEKMLVDLIKEMLSQNIKCEVAVLTKNNNFFGKELDILNIPVYYGDTSKVYNIRNILFLKNIIKTKEYNCIHTHLYAPQLFTPLACQLINKKIQLLTTEHSTHNKRRNNKIFYLLDKWMYMQYSKIVAITKDTRTQLINYLPNLASNTVVIENGINEKIYSNAEPLAYNEISAEIKDEEKIILMVAGMREQKDPETLIRASKLLPKECRVVFVGEGERMEEVKRYAKEFGRNNILFLGARTDVPSLMKAATVFVLSSKWEGFGLVVVEAAAAGLPIIATDVEGLRDVVAKVGGNTFTPYDEKELSQLITQNLNEKIKKRSISTFSISTTAKKYLELYEVIIK
ncbi:glycosyltransferase [Solibacillus sp. FSL W7-1324]|uniref:glycosyltransferase n=1 Tax=Solibacillus sp. FSL W7-1324 TaxID=2921701 RepID=UPI0030F7F360